MNKNLQEQVSENKQQLCNLNEEIVNKEKSNKILIEAVKKNEIELKDLEY